MSGRGRPRRAGRVRSFATSGCVAHLAASRTPRACLHAAVTTADWKCGYVSETALLMLAVIRLAIISTPMAITAPPVDPQHK